MSHSKKILTGWSSLIAVFISAVLLAVLAGRATAQPGTGGLPSFAPDRLIIQLRPNAVGGIDSVLARHAIQSASLLFKGNTNLNGLDRIYRFDLLSGSDVQQTVKMLTKDPDVEWAEPDYLAYPISDKPHNPTDITPNDPLLDEEWGLSKIGAPAAWQVTTGSPTVAIAIIDSGIDMSHSDLAGKLWVNPGEIAGNGIDDDNNGFIDDVNGWDFVNHDNNPSDDEGHGTQVAGVAAAATDNAVGMAGLCWDCRIMVVKVMQASGVANYSDIAAGVLYAAQKGAKIINLSLGGYSDSHVLHAAIQTAVNDYGAVVVGGAGNDNTNTRFYPAAYEEVLAVAGTDENDVKSAVSNYGSWVDVSAPAVAITTTFMGGDYGATNGTSFAASFVSGLVGLVRSEHPDWTPALVGAQILHTADPIDTLNPGYTGMLGSGRINAANAVTVTPHPILAIHATAVNGDPLGHPDPGGTASLQVTLGNDWLDASAVQGVLSSSDAYVTVITSTASFGNIVSGGMGTGSPLYSFSVASGAGYNHAILFNLNVTSNDGGYSVDLLLTLTTRSGNQNVGGTIGTDTTWTSDKTYIVINNIRVAPGITLTIQAGTTVKFNGNYSLNAGGTLLADGTESQPIRFMSNTGGTWGRINFEETSLDATTDITGTYQSGNILRWVTIYGASQGIGCNKATPFLEHVTSDGGGISCVAGGTALWVKDSDISGSVQISDGDGVGSVFGKWRTRAIMPTGRGGLGVAAALNGKIYAIGGSGVTCLDTMEEYDPATDTWTTRASMPTARCGLGAAAASNGKIYAIGGENAVYLNTVEEYDPATDTWATRASMPTERGFLGVVAAPNGKIYAIGGSNSTHYELGTVEEYDPATDTWATRASLQTQRSYFGAATGSNGKIYVIGGNETWSYQLIEEYDPSIDTWTYRASIPTGRISPGAAAAPNGKIYAIGGHDINGNDLTSGDEYDPTTNTWAARASMSIPRSGLGVVTALNGKIYAIGSYNTFTYHTNEEYTTPTGRYGYYFYNNRIQNGGLSLPGYSEVLTSTVDRSLTTGISSLVQNNTVENGSISIGSGLIRENMITGGGINISGGSALSNTISGGGINARNSSLVRGNNIENSPGWGILTMNGSADVLNNRLVGNVWGIGTEGGLVEGNLIANQSSFGLETNGTMSMTLSVISNTFTAVGGSAIKIPGIVMSSLNIQGNNFEFNTGSYDIENLTPNNITAQNNWWGTADPAVIGQRIFDYYDDYTKGIVLYTPVDSGPIRSAPAYVRNVTVTPNPVGIETAIYNVLFSREMDFTNPVMFAYQNFIPGTWSYYNPANADYFFWVNEDPQGGIWAGTLVKGVARLYHNIWTIYDTTNSGLPSNAVVNTAFGADGSVWFSTWGAGLARFDGTNWTVYNSSNSGLPNDYVYPIVFDSDHTLWIGTEGGLAHFDGVNWTIYNTSNSGLPSNGIHSISIDLRGRKWFGTYAGAAVFDGSNWTTYTSANSGLPNAGIYDISFDPDGSIWFGTWGAGAAHFDGSNWWVYTTANSALLSNYVGTVAIDLDGSKWFGTNNYIARFDGTTWTQYYTGLTSGLDDRLFIDRTGSKWISTWGGGIDVLGGATISIANDPRWLDSTHYQVSVNVDARIDRGAYTIGVQGAFGADGIEIAPNSTYTFTVDYAGGVGDTTPPPAPTVLACGAASPDILSASWYASDPESNIDRYQFAIGTTSGGADVINWTNTTNTSFVRDGLSLTSGQTYYVSVKARNTGGLWSEAGVSSGVVAGSGACPSVNFIASSVTGPAPFTVQFTDTSTGTINSWLWDFGDGETDIAQNPTHLYGDTGIYTVSLVVSGPNGSDLLVKPDYITVTQFITPPVASFFAAPLVGRPPLIVTFTDTSSGAITSWLWDFGDDITSTLASPTHIYQLPGIYTVTLTVSVPGGSDIESKVDYITVQQGIRNIFLPMILRNSQGGVVYQPTKPAWKLTSSLHSNYPIKLGLAQSVLLLLYNGIGIIGLLRYIL